MLNILRDIEHDQECNVEDLITLNNGALATLLHRLLKDKVGALPEQLLSVDELLVCALSLAQSHATTPRYHPTLLTRTASLTRTHTVPYTDRVFSRPHSG